MKECIDRLTLILVFLQGQLKHPISDILVDLKTGKRRRETFIVIYHLLKVRLIGVPDPP